MGDDRREGFTLVELLVVIAVIAVLAAVLFPVMLSVRHKARLASCQTHQKQLAAALIAYTSDHGGWLPHVQFLSPGGWGKLFCDPYVKNRQILACPAQFFDRDGSPGWLPRRRNMGFAYNQHCLCDTVRIKSTVRGTDVYETRRHYTEWTGRPLAEIRTTSRTPAFFCAESVHTVDSLYGTVYVGFGWEPTDARNPGRMVNAHNEGTNYAFLDGHVRWLRPAGDGLYQATEGLDYDGNGTVGDAFTLR